MEHIIQFGVTIDDDAIQKQIVRNASEKIRREVEEMGRKRYGGGSGLEDMAKAELHEYIKNHKDTLFEMVAKEIAKNLARTKAAKEIISKMEEGGI